MRRRGRAVKPQGALVALPFLFLALLLLVVPQIDASRDARAAIIIVACIASIAASALLYVWVSRRAG